jgi:pyruvate/2-oxoglutarate dehydrogenase complex dihydrolipoamide dehydrogenase (E3) component
MLQLEHKAMSAADTYQAIVIGSGQGGTPLAGALAAAGLRTALIERVHIGGTCVNEGCTPTKTMIASARVAYLARRAADYGVHTGDIRIDMQRVRQRKRDVVDSFRGGSQRRLEKTANLELIFGEASFISPKSLAVRLRDGNRRMLAADRIFINAGARPAIPKLDGLNDVPFLDSTSIMELDSVPGHLLILGGGYVGLEFGQMFRRLGSRVTLVHSGAQLLAREDPDVATEVASILKQDGIEILLNAKAKRAAKSPAGVELTVRSSGETRTLSGSHLLVATGRMPNTDTLNVAAAGIATGPKGFIRVNAKLETNVVGVYALGDIKGEPAYTHISYDDFRILRTNLIEEGSASAEGRLVPYTVFIDPQLGRVGLTETDARAQHKKIRVARMPMKSVARALEADETRGFLKAIVDDETHQILGAAVLGIEGGEIMSMFEIAMMGRLPFTSLRDGIFAHPNLAESLNNLFTHFDANTT